MAELVKLEKWALAFLTEAQLGGVPASCFGCHLLYSRQKTCAIIGPDVIIDRLVSGDGKTYTPVCSELDPGKPVDVPDEAAVYSSSFLGPVKADAICLALAAGTGTNCGGVNGGAVCTKHYFPDGPKRGGCRPLQATVQAGDCCAAHNGSALTWRNAQAILKRGA